MARVWLITGCSSGFGKEIALAVLAHGDHVIATARNLGALEDLKAKGATTLALDITASDESVQQVIDEAAKAYGTIDILVNNAGYMLMGAIEECSSQEVADQFNTNVFGTLRVTRAVLPLMRKQGAGIIANMGSMTGWFGPPLAGSYVATKFAIAGLSSTLRLEVAPFGIEVIVLEPGNFRTDVLGSRCIKVQNPRADLEMLSAPVRQMYASVNGNQPGDTQKGAQVIVELLTKSGRCAKLQGQKLPSRFVIGSDAVQYVKGVLAEGTQTINEWEDLMISTNVSP